MCNKSASNPSNEKVRKDNKIKCTSSASSTKATTWALIRFFLDCTMLNDDGPLSRPVLCNQPAVST